jgi:hypothetical protein
MLPPMELRRKRFSVLSGIFLIGGIVLLINARTDTVRALFTLVSGVAAVILGGWMIYRRLRPFRVHIGPDGLALRTSGLNRLVVWSEIHAVVMAGEAPISKLRRCQGRGRAGRNPAVSGPTARLRSDRRRRLDYASPGGDARGHRPEPGGGEGSA